jgi:hypothetical protein
MRESCALLLLASLVLAGCEAASGFGNRYGPDPGVPSKLVAASVDNQIDIMAKLAEATDCRGEQVDQDAVNNCHYQTTIVGFNFVDEQCDAYLRELFALDTERDRLKTVISGADKLTNAVLAVSPASKITMAIVAQSFGLTNDYVNVAADSYLFKADAGLVYNVVATLQASYRNGVYNNKNLITSRPESYSAIRGYLRLCLPPTIQSKISTTLARAVAEDVGAGTPPGTLQNPDLAPEQ